jgi:hypothetical protein
MEIGTRKADAEKALAAMREKLKGMNVELREAEVRTNADAGDAGGTALFSALNAALSDAPPDRVSGAIVITDGEVHDAPDPKTFHLGAPFHVLITGAPNERDRKLTVVRATRFNIVGKDAARRAPMPSFRCGSTARTPASATWPSARIRPSR